ncbi:MAG: hypothetical protein HY258_01755 [Chloroflexi bacterium]|nr:hypothetical protein [Chloroflexota bacterium]
MSLVKRIISIPWVAYLVASLGGAMYAFNALIIARTKTSYLDEGLYLYKGLLYATGIYKPYQDYGPWTNHMPLVFLIHGYIQKWFGPSLATGRYFMVVLGLLTCLGLWILARRWGGNWWAAGIVWAMALNPAEIKIYTLAISEGLIAILMVWMLVCVLGVKRPMWQIMLSAVLGALIVSVRETMLFVPVILILFILWRYGWKTTIQAGLLALFVFIAVNSFFWPDILKSFISWTPESLRSPFAAWLVPPSALGTRSSPDEVFDLFTAFLYLFLTFRLHLLALGSVLGVWLLWPRLTRPLTERTRAAIFLSVIIVVNFVLHIYVSFRTACVSCILLYVGFFDYLGLLVLVIAFRFIARQLPVWRRTLVFFIGALVIFGVGFSTYEDINSDFANSLIDRMDRFYPWNVLQHFIQLQPLMLFRQTFAILVSLSVILLFAILLIIIIRLSRDRKAAARQSAFTALNLFLATALVLSPTIVLGKGNDFFDCGDTNVLQSYQQAGDYLASVIPPGSHVYWDGRLDAIFLYVPGVIVYPPQLNHVHNYFTGGDADTLYRFSLWNDALARQWIREADYVLLQKGFEQDWEVQAVQGAGYKKLDSTRKLEKCQWQSVIDVYQRVKP